MVMQAAKRCKQPVCKFVIEAGSVVFGAEYRFTIQTG
jgi:hypothetical protein